MKTAASMRVILLASTTRNLRTVFLILPQTIGRNRYVATPWANKLHFGLIIVELANNKA